MRTTSRCPSKPICDYRSMPNALYHNRTSSKNTWMRLNGINHKIDKPRAVTFTHTHGWSGEFFVIRTRKGVRGVAGVARATPIFQVLFQNTLSSKALKPLSPQALKSTSPKPLSPKALKPTSQPLSPKALKLSSSQPLKHSNPQAHKSSNP